MKPALRRTHTQPDSPADRKASGSRNKIIPLVIFALFAMIVVSQEHSWLHEQFQRLVNPEAFSALSHCREATLADSQPPEFARILRGGNAHKTTAGYVVDALVVGEMGADGGELPFSITCYVDRQGTVASLHREPLNRHDAETRQPRNENRSLKPQ
ncbi:MAG: hypothetical protein ACWA5X_13320 [bacterium]